MTAQMTTDTKQTITKAAGWLYFLIILSSILSLVFLGGKFNVLGDSAASVSKMAQHENLVRINAVYEAAVISKGTEPGKGISYLKAFITLKKGYIQSTRLNYEIKAFLKGNKNDVASSSPPTTAL